MTGSTGRWNEIVATRSCCGGVEHCARIAMAQFRGDLALVEMHARLPEGGENMSLELTTLVWAVALAFVQMLIALSGAILQIGLPRLADNRADMPVLTGWAGRAQRAHVNMLESLVLFAPLVLIAENANKINVVSGAGVQLYFWARVGYAVVYIAGIPWLRTAVWGASVVGMIMVFSVLFWAIVPDWIIALF